MRKKLMRVGLVAACHMLLISGISYASQTNEAYFAFPSPDTITDSIEGYVDESYVETFKETYEVVYDLEKSMKYFSADEKWFYVEELASEMEPYLKKDDDESFDIMVNFIDQIEDLHRDYRYGLPTFQEAYDLELKDYMDNVSADYRDDIIGLLEKDYEKIESTYEKYIESGDAYKRIEFQDERWYFNQLFEWSQSKDQILVGENSTYVLPYVYMNVEQLGNFMNEKFVRDVLDEKSIEKIEALLSQAKNVHKSSEVEGILIEAKWMLEGLFDSKLKGYEGKNRTDIEIINKLYDELDTQ